MEMRNLFVPRLGQTHIAGGWRYFSGCGRWPEKFCWAWLLFAFVGAQAALIQLSVGSTPPLDAQGTGADTRSRPQLAESFGRLPLIFEAADVEGTRFFCRGSGSHLWLSPVEAVLTFNPARKEPRKLPGIELFASRATDEALTGAPLRIKWVGANPKARAVPAEELPTRVNYFIGNEPEHWQRNVPIFGSVQVEETYPGINLVHYGTQRQYEFDFVVAPGADPRAIAFQVSGADRVEIAQGADAPCRIGMLQVLQHLFNDELGAA